MQKGFAEIELLDLQSGRGKTVFENHEISSLITQALVESKQWDIGLGFFSFSSFTLLAAPLARFLLDGGRIRIYTNEYLSEADYRILTESDSPPPGLQMFKDFESIYEALNSPRGVLFQECISYLLTNNLLEVKALVRKDSGFGISHQKNFIFRSPLNETLVLSGSPNLSRTALNFNGETVNAVCSIWSEAPNDYIDVTIKSHLDIFEKYFSGEDDEWISLSFDSKDLRERIHELGFRVVSKDELEGALAKHENATDRTGIEVGEEANKPMEKNESKGNGPQFPHPEPFDYQVEAYQEWKKANYKGLFAMATGTGKTLTAINCLVQEYGKVGHRYIFVVPGKTLVEQWTEELTESRFGPLIQWYSGANMAETKRNLNQLLGNDNTKINLVITYDGFRSSSFRNIIGSKLEDFTIVFDECHELGSPENMTKLPDVSKCRLIGLSATPARQFDEAGSNEFIHGVFNCEAERYTFEFSLERAIKENYLVPYNYFVDFVRLTDPEWEEYKELTRKLWGSDEAGKAKVNEFVAIQRARIVKRAFNKLDATVQVLSRLIQADSFKYTLLFCPEGKSQEEAQEDSNGKDEINRYLDRLCDEFNDKHVKFAMLSSAEDAYRRELLSTFSEGEELHVLLNKRMLNQGVDIPAIRNAIMVSSETSLRTLIQRRGRILRKAEGKTEANLYDFLVLPPEGNSIDGVGASLLLNEFRRVHELAQYSLNVNDFICNFDKGLSNLAVMKNYQGLINEMQQNEQ